MAFGICRKQCLLRITYANRLLDVEPDIFRHIPVYPWISVEPRADPVKIAVHIRRGELFVIDSQRMLPNEYYYRIMEQLHQMLKASNTPHEFTIYTEQPTRKDGGFSPAPWNLESV
jgi:hypothetical protein